MNRFLCDPNSPNYEAARHRVAKVLRAMGMEDARAGFTDMANDLLAGDLMQIPTWIALGIMAKTDATEGDTSVCDEGAVTSYDGTTLSRIRAGEQMQFCESGGLWAAMLGGAVQYQAWTPNESRVKGFSEGYNLALRHAAFAAAPEATHDR